MLTRRLAVVLALSVVLHAGALAALVTLASHVDVDSALFIDLVADDPRASADAAPQEREAAPSPAASERPASRGAVMWGKIRSRIPASPLSREASDPSRRAPAPPISQAEPSAPPSPAPPPAVSPPTFPAPEPRDEQQRSATTDVSPPASSSVASSMPAAGSGAPIERGDRTTGGRAGNTPPGVGRANGSATGGAGDTGAAGPGGGDGHGDGALASIGGGGDSPGAEYGTYLAALRRRIAESLRYPLSARRRGVTGTVQLEIVIAVSGAITAVDVVVSSSHPLLDEAAVETVKALPPQPFPPDVRARTLRVRLPVVFTLQ